MIYMRNYIARLHLRIHFSDHILKCFRVIAKNVTISLNMIIEGDFVVALWRH